MAAFIARKDEYATSTDPVRDLRRWKVMELVDHFMRRPAYAHLKGRNPVFLVTPSTTGTNKLPYYFAKRLQSELGGQIVTGWAAPLERQKASVKGGLGKMRNPAKFAAIEDKIASLPADRPLVLVDDVVTTGETTDALRELLEQQERQAHCVASLGQSEMRKVSPRDIERITDKLGEPSLKPAIEGVLTGRLKHKANYIERVIHEGTRQEIRDYFSHEHRRLQGLGAVHAVAAVGLRHHHASDHGLQFQGNHEAGDPGEGEHEVGPSAGHAASERGVLIQAKSSDPPNQTEADLVFQLEELQEMVRRGMDGQRACEHGMALLKSDKIQAAPRMFLNHELSQALKNERGAKPMKEIVQAADEMKKPSQAISPKNINRTRKVG